MLPYLGTPPREDSGGARLAEGALPFPRLRQLWREFTTTTTPPSPCGPSA